MRESYCILRSGYVTAGDQQIQHSQIHRWSIDLPRYDDQLSPFVCKEIPTTKPSATVKEKNKPTVREAKRYCYAWAPHLPGRRERGSHRNKQTLRAEFPKKEEDIKYSLFTCCKTEKYTYRLAPLSIDVDRCR